MPQYELMYLLGSNVADTDVPAITEQVQKFIADFGGTDIKEQNLGKKKLAYPIGKTRNGTYVVVNFSMDGRKVNDLDARIRTQDNTIIRYLLINIDEHLERTQKDQEAAAKLNRRIPAAEESATEIPAAENREKKEETANAATERKAKSAVKIEDINQEDLDKRIEAALSEDITK